MTESYSEPNIIKSDLENQGIVSEVSDTSETSSVTPLPPKIEATEGISPRELTGMTPSQIQELINRGHRIPAHYLITRSKSRRIFRTW